MRSSNVSDLKRELYYALIDDVVKELGRCRFGDLGIAIAPRLESLKRKFPNLKYVLLNWNDDPEFKAALSLFHTPSGYYAHPQVIIEFRNVNEVAGELSKALSEEVKKSPFLFPS